MQKQFIAHAIGINSNSGFKNTRKECEDWAAKFLSGHPAIGLVLICETIAAAERAHMPVTITDIHETPSMPETFPAKDDVHQPMGLSKAA